MSKIAIDIVLLPSDDMMDLSIEINKELLKKYDNKIILDKKHCSPHISLCMWCIEQEDLSNIKNILSYLSKKYSFFELIAESLKWNIIPTWKVVSWLKIKNDKTLNKLQNEIMKKSYDYLSYKPEKNMLFNPSEIENVTFGWIIWYEKIYNDPNLYRPHITVGFWESNNYNFPINFEWYKLAIFQLWNYCTCRKKLFEVELKEK